VMLGLIAEAVAGTDSGPFHQRLFGPLGLDTHLLPAERRTDGGHRHGYRVGPPSSRRT
jgi:CubicO group peptidase (beta-lactamase class C family)